MATMTVFQCRCCRREYEPENELDLHYSPTHLYQGDVCAGSGKHNRLELASQQQCSFGPMMGREVGETEALAACGIGGD